MEHFFDNLVQEDDILLIHSSYTVYVKVIHPSIQRNALMLFVSVFCVITLKYTIADNQELII